MNQTIPVESEELILDAEKRTALVAEIADAIREHLREPVIQEVLAERIRTGLFR